MSEVPSLSNITAENIIKKLPKTVSKKLIKQGIKEFSKQTHNIVMFIKRNTSDELNDIAHSLEFLLILCKEFDEYIFSIFSPFIRIMDNCDFKYLGMYVKRDDIIDQILKFPELIYIEHMKSLYNLIYNSLDFGFNKKESKQLIQFINKYEDKNYIDYFEIKSVPKYSIIYIYY
ncbi:unnamed protein product, partial [marine sediment metagenome]